MTTDFQANHEKALAMQIPLRHIGSMTLKEYLETTKTRQEDFAALIGVRQGTISRLANGGRWPSRETIVRVAEATNGLVSISDWVSGIKREAAE